MAPNSCGRVAVIAGHVCDRACEALEPQAVASSPATTTQEDSEGPLVTLEHGERSGSMGRITLRRAKKLNSLSLGMIRELRQAYASLNDDSSPSLRCVLLQGEGKAFCAGGDVAACRESILASGRVHMDFFYEEYILIHEIAMLHERKGIVQVALWNGIVMGGGVGLSAHCPIRIATERTLFAMPETAIGLFPDVGMTWLLSRLKVGEAVGFYLGLTGMRLGAADCLHAGLATHFCPSDKLPLLEAALRELGDAAGSIEAVSAAIEKLCGDAKPDNSKSVLSAQAAAIARCFGGEAATAENIVDRLEAENSAWSKDTLTKLRAGSPISVKVTLSAIQKHRAVSLREALIMEYRISQWCMRLQPQSDFCEGIRAVLVDKDHKARWQPPRLEELSASSVEAFFAPLGPTHLCGDLPL